ncbi:BnaC05g09090D [Brassica napus]|uniref:BnaC05g09090D protein n=1 Tax=Brassica napus TaxID=3708 RepID=A0A078FYD5_BRANA|nr:BnaC05g09090D [Brassica napus]
MGVYHWIQRIFCYFLDIPVEIIGNLASIEKAKKLINEVIAQVGVIISRGDYQEHADKVESTDSGCPFYL